MRGKLFVATIMLALVASSAAALHRNERSLSQAETKTLVERLGYPRDAKLLIVHADDLGAAHSINSASIKALESGLVGSGSIMVPCPWLPEIAAYARAHPEADLGLHLTLTSEWSSYRWGPVLGRERVPSLLDSSGYLPLESEATTHMDIKEVEAEIRAQIARARAFGIQPTHLDSHMDTLYHSKVLFEILLRVARENKLPFRVSQQWFARAPFMPALLGPDDPVLNRTIIIEPKVAPEDWARFYTEEIKNLRPGVTDMIVHLAFADEEMKGMTSGHPNWGAEWRQRDFAFVTSDAFRKLLKENNVKLITWREIGKLIGKT
ncbi:MAG TPA: polysaccharide deacetylase family protein, partial [Pyrinomonadaceae bacterium]|nr:polysaccharide deacetylase family protein [Pyrinomonadaceae bacterium]